MRPPRLERCRPPISWSSTCTLMPRVRPEPRCRAHRMQP